MKGEDFLREINNIDESIIEEAKQPKGKKKINGNIIKFIGLAACITVFTGAVVARSIGLWSDKDVLQKDTGRDKNEVTEGENIESDSLYPDLPEGKLIKWQNYDLNKDGTEDIITIDIPAAYESKMITCTITDGASKNEIYQITMSLAYYDWKEIYLYEKDEEIYLIQYQPILYQGDGEYIYEILYFNNQIGEILVDKENMAFNLLDSENYVQNIIKMGDFYYEVNAYLSESVLLISTVNGELKYSTKEDMLHKTEEYDFLYECDIKYTQENIYLKLDQYFSYLEVYLDDVQKNISLALKQETLSDSGASFEIVNAGSVDGYSGEYFWIEQLDEENGEWIRYPSISNEVKFSDERWEIKNGETISFAVDWSEIYGNLREGYYRLLKNVSFGNYIFINICCYFDIGGVVDLDSETNSQNKSAVVDYKK